MKKGHIFFIMWVSWAGKGTLINNLKKEKLDLYIPLSYKTRPKREFEKDWVDAYFISRQDFEKAIENNEFLEYAIVHWKEYYWTKYDDVIKNGIDLWKIVIKEIDILGLKKLIKQKPELRPFYTTIFLNIPVEKLRERIQKRWEFILEEQLKLREQSAIMEEKEARKYCDYMLDATLDPQTIKDQVVQIIKAKIKK